MKISILGSGSGGNSTFVEIEDYKILVDTGFSCKKTEEKLENQLNKKIAISTDIGYITNIVREYFKDVDAMVIESNYDFNTLMNCSYPWNLKERVKSRNGHLSNNECAKFIKEMYTDKLKKVFLAHVSKDSNNISLIKETLEDEFIGMIRKPNCEITTQDNVTKLFDIDK